MEKKYSSIHIYVSEKENILSKIKEYYKRNIFKKKKIEALNMIKDETVRQMIGSLPGFLASEILIIQTDSFISIYDESTSFETVEDTAKGLSKVLSLPLLYFSNFDDDIFFFGGFQSGKLVSSRKLGDGLEAYDLSSKEFNVGKFCNIFSMFKREFVEYINIIKQIDIIENAIEGLLQLPLSMRLCDAQTHSKEFIELDCADGVHIYKK